VLEVVIHQHIDNPGHWHVTSHAIGVERRELAAASVDGAKEEALRICHRAVSAFAQALEGAAP
jgi:hypothetical protein